MAETNTGYVIDVLPSVTTFERFRAPVARCVEAALRAENGPFGSKIAVVLCGDAEIALYHERFMSIPGPTDVISWAADAPLGDVMVSCETARRQAAAYGNSWEREVCVLAVHGTLHLLGWSDHNSEDRHEMQVRVDAIIDGCHTREPDYSGGYHP